MRKRGKAAFERALANAAPLSEYLVSEMTALHPPTTAEGRAALIAAVRPLLAQISAPILAALLRKRLGELSGLPESELRTLLHPAPAPRKSEEDRPDRRTLHRAGARRPPSLARELIQAILLQPELARQIELPRPADGTPEGDALAALVEACAATVGPLTTPALMQRFAGTAHESILVAALTTAEDQGLTAEHADARLREGTARWWKTSKMRQTLG